MPCDDLDVSMETSMQPQSQRRRNHGWKVASWVALHCNVM